jgi:rhodanese-related sulfurtransferase
MPTTAADQPVREQSRQPLGVREVEPREVAAWLASGEAVLVDVRETDEHAREHIEGAMSMPLSSFDPQSLDALSRRGARIVFQCKGGKRSAEATRLTLVAGPSCDAASLKGGLDAWKAAGLPTRRDRRAPALSVMRQVQLTVGLGVLAGSALAWFVDPRFVAVPAFFGAGLAFAGATGTCALASVLAAMPWNRVPAPDRAQTCCQPR